MAWDPERVQHMLPSSQRWWWWWRWSMWLYRVSDNPHTMTNPGASSILDIQQFTITCYTDFMWKTAKPT